MARLHKFKGVDTLPGVGNPQVVADTAVGAATAELGRQIGNSTTKISSLARKRQEQVNSFELAKAALKYDRDAHARLSLERSFNRPGAIGLTEAMLSHLDASARANTEDLPEDAKEQFEQDFGQTREQFVQLTTAIEAAENENYYRQGLGEVGDLLVSIVRESPDTIDYAIGRASEIFKSLPLPAKIKESGLRQIREQLVESWFEQLSFAEQIDVLTDLKMARSSRAVLSGPVAGSRGSESPVDSVLPEQLTTTGKPTGSSVPIQKRLQYLQPHTQNKLLAKALRKRSVASIEEEGRLTAQIEHDPLAMNPRDFLGNEKLEPGQRDRLILRLEAESREQEKNLAAVRWLGDGGAGKENGAEQQELADRAFTYLNNGETDRASLARTILLSKGTLPSAYRKSLSNALGSADASVMGAALDELAELAKIAPESLTGSPAEGQTETALNVHRTLTERIGLTRTEVAERLASANKPGRRNELLDEFEVQLRRGDIETAHADKLLSDFDK